MHSFNSQSAQYCCICKYWYDPTNSAITPIAASINMWGITCDMYNDRKICTKKNILKSAVDNCPYFNAKI